MFHAQIGTWNKTVLIYQFENNMFLLQLGTWNEMFTFYTFCSYLVKKLALLESIGTQKRGTVDARGTFLFTYWNSQGNLKSVTKGAKT